MTTSYQIIEAVKRKIGTKWLEASDTDVAKALNVTRATVSAYKNGRAVMSLDTFAKAATIMELPTVESMVIAMRLQTELTTHAPTKALFRSFLDTIDSNSEMAKKTLASILLAVLAGFGAFALPGQADAHVTLRAAASQCILSKILNYQPPEAALRYSMISFRAAASRSPP